MSEERRYTLDEARRELARSECRMHGHDFDVLVTAAGIPTAVLCSRCGEAWTVQSGDARPTTDDEGQERKTG